MFVLGVCVWSHVRAGVDHTTRYFPDYVHKTRIFPEDHCFIPLLPRPLYVWLLRATVAMRGRHVIKQALHPLWSRHRLTTIAYQCKKADRLMSWQHLRNGVIQQDWTKTMNYRNGLTTLHDSWVDIILVEQLCTAKGLLVFVFSFINSLMRDPTVCL